MYIASKKRKENIAEHILYMWQIEDMIRANGLDMDKITRTLIDPANPTPEQRRELTEWYESLIDMMRREGVTEHGHLQMNTNMLMQLVDLHQALLKDPKEGAQYTAQFYKTLPYIVELRAKADAGKPLPGEIETCFNALYGMLLMRLQGKEISEATRQAIEQISRFIAMLARHFHQQENNPKPIED